MTTVNQKEVADSSVLTRLVQGAWAKQPAWFFDRRVPCHGLSDLFYPDRHSGEVMQAKMLCWSQCPYVEECLEWALANNEKHGVWGGTSERERRKMRRARRAAAAVTVLPLPQPRITESKVKVIKVKRRFTKKKLQRVS